MLTWGTKPVLVDEKNIFNGGKIQSSKEKKKEKEGGKKEREKVKTKTKKKIQKNGKK